MIAKDKYWNQLTESWLLIPDDNIIIDLPYIKREIGLAVKSILWRNVDTWDLTVMTTWSSWREEEYSALDDLELLVYWETKDIEEQIIEEIRKYSWKCKILLEIKNKSFPDYYENQNDDWKTFFPSRFIDSLVLFWKWKYYEELKSIFIDNIQNVNWKEIKNWKNRLKYHSDISKIWQWSWKKEEFKVYDVKHKRINYYKDTNKEISIKIWPLRSIQYKLVLIIMKLIRDDKIINSDNFDEIWKSIDSKIDFLENLWYLTTDDIVKLKSFYSYFLWIHNEMTSKFNKKWEWYFELTNEEFELFLSNLDEFNTLIKRINV